MCARLVWFLAIFFILFPFSVSAEEDQGDYTLDPLTVTAQKREENVQEVPASIGVITGFELEQRGISEMKDLSGVIPNLYISTVGGAATFSQLGIRGRINGMGDMDPTVTVMVDGVPYDDFYSSAANLLFDVERVEVLRGPQSTLYGLNSTAGIINIITRKPGDTQRLSFGAQYSQGSDFDGAWRVRGSASGPLVPGKLAAGLAFAVESQDGYIENLHTGDTYNSDDAVSGRGSLVWTPTDRLTADLGFSYTKIDADYGYLYLPMTGSAARGIGQRKQDWTTDIDHEGSSSVETTAGNLNLAYTADVADIISITAFRHSDQDYDLDFDLTSFPYPMTMVGAMESEFKTFSQEVRLQSPKNSASPLEWLAGAFYHHFDREQSGASGYTMDGLFPMMDTKLTGKSVSLFGQSTWRTLEDRQLGFTVGLRQEWTKRELEDNVYGIPDMDTDDSELLPKFSVDYRFTPDTMTYVSVTRGWRPGGLYNSFVVMDPSFDTDRLEFDKETSWTWELGVKTRFFQDRLTLNAAVFHTDYKDYQDIVWYGPFESYLSNAGKARMTGFEVESLLRIHDDILVSASFGYVDAQYRSFHDGTESFSGNTVAGVPDFNGNLAVTWHFLDGFYIRPEVQGVGKIYWDRANTADQDPYCLFNFRAGYAATNWEVYVFGANLTDEYSFVSGMQFLQNSMGLDEWYGTPITPRRFGIGFSLEF